MSQFFPSVAKVLERQLQHQSFQWIFKIHFLHGSIHVSVPFSQIIPPLFFLQLFVRPPELTHWKRPWCWERLKAGGKRMTEDEMVGWHHWLNRHEFEQALGDGDGQGSLACCSPLGHKESDQLSNSTDWSSPLSLRRLHSISSSSAHNGRKQNPSATVRPLTQKLLCQHSTFVQSS